MKTVHKLQDLAQHMALEPAEEVRAANIGRLAPCGLVVEEKSSQKRRKEEELGVFHAAMPGLEYLPHAAAPELVQHHVVAQH